MIGLSGMTNFPPTNWIACPSDGMALPLYDTFMSMFLSGLSLQLREWKRITHPASQDTSEALKSARNYFVGVRASIAGFPGFLVERARLFSRAMKNMQYVGVPARPAVVNKVFARGKAPNAGGDVVRRPASFWEFTE